MTYRTYTPEEPKLGWMASAREMLSRVTKPLVDTYNKYQSTGQLDTFLGLSCIGVGAMSKDTFLVAGGTYLAMMGFKQSRADLLQRMQGHVQRQMQRHIRRGHGPRLAPA